MPSLGLARLQTLAPDHRRIGLSATVADVNALRAWIEPQSDDEGADELAALVEGGGGATPEIAILDTDQRIPWAGHSARHSIGDIYWAIERARMALVFVNTRSQAETIFQQLWMVNEAGLPIALHHGSLDATQRRKVEAAMAAGTLRAVVSTSTLDLGIDWGEVDLVINVGAPKGSSRILQRIGRANHHLEETIALLVRRTAEVLECEAARAAVIEGAGYRGTGRAQARCAVPAYSRRRLRRAAIPTRPRGMLRKLRLSQARTRAVRQGGRFRVEFGGYAPRL